MSSTLSRRDFTELAGLFLASFLVDSGSLSVRGAMKKVLNPFRLDAVDLCPFMKHGIDHIYTGAIDRRYFCHPFGRFNLTDPPTCAIHLP